jgi:hypothetical protein
MVAPIRDPGLKREQTARTFLQQYRHMKERQVVKDQGERAGGKERGLRGTRADSVERAACATHVPGEDALAPIQNQDLAEISRS